MQKVQAELQHRAEEAAKIKSEIGELEVKHAELKVERKQLEQQKEEKESHGAQQQTEISRVSYQDDNNNKKLQGQNMLIFRLKEQKKIRKAKYKRNAVYLTPG